MKHILLALSLLAWGVNSCVYAHAETLREQANATNKADNVTKKNQQKFDALKKYDLPMGQYAVIGSGPLGVRNLREIGDIDIIVSQELKDKLIAKYGMVDDGKVKKIVFPKDDIEAFWEGSFYTQPKDDNRPTVESMIKHAEIIDGLPFQSLQDVLYFKRKMNRPKDLEDVRLIEKWQKDNAQPEQRSNGQER
jgi:hypothetical protein